ncbi:Transposase InsO and inactivated derivatives [Algoriphagus alkaliphilus]|uniref:Transposase InsO and inactivated derivatives n=1 Tax=Algoriphagus alkaliphilus TaxID=279824 RepID=A0A1G5ZQI9_9BACT|nr:DDE-type integrase/transposase/recombinase [Algoriphagus alkaliphilus]SDA94505.1 Transposase InsO and inactivated derivatives [Algoriphagus alkaliphilus]SDA96593.1 Transposase InsO and inactivated derivatives [Algoriphagus alkaliphilus]
MKHQYLFSVKQACELLGFSRQAYYKALVDKPELSDHVTQLANSELCKARTRCPSLGCRSMYEDFGHLLPIGRDKSIELFMDMGYRVRYPKRYGRATQSGTREFPNLLVEKNVNGLNQVWEADMAHYLYGDTKLYTIYITDVYSQEIVGFGAYSTNLAINYAEVMDQAIREAKSKGLSLQGLIHHSDGGKQYESVLYKMLCNRHAIKQSMCMYSYENPYAEKTNDLINNGYLNIWRPKSLKELRACQLKAVKDHNERRPKKALKKLSPVQFRNQILNDRGNSKTYNLELKPRIPEQPRKRIEIKPLILTDTRQ